MTENRNICDIFDLVSKIQTVGMFCGCILLQRKITDAYPRFFFPKDSHIWSGKKCLHVNVTLLKAG